MDFKTIKTAYDYLFLIISVVLLLYIILVMTPENQRLLRECQTEQLCRNNLMTGELCRPFLDPDFDPLNYTIPIEDLPGIGEN